MADRFLVNIELSEPWGVVLTVEALPRLLIFGDTRDAALRHAREAISFSFGHGDGPVELLIHEHTPAWPDPGAIMAGVSVRRQAR